MKIDDKLKRINEALNYFTEKGEEPQIKKISKYLKMSSQNFYYTYKDYVDYVNSCISTIKFNQISEQVKLKNYTLLEIYKTTDKVYNLLIQCPNSNHKPFLSNRYKYQCPECAREKLQNDGLAKAQAIAKSHGGECLSTTYKNQLSKITFKCKNEKHPPFTTTFLNVQYGKSWCRACSYESKRALKLATDSKIKKDKR